MGVAARNSQGLIIEIRFIIKLGYAKGGDKKSWIPDQVGNDPPAMLRIALRAGIHVPILSFP